MAAGPTSEVVSPQSRRALRQDGRGPDEDEAPEGNYGVVAAGPTSEVMSSRSPPGSRTGQDKRGQDRTGRGPRGQCVVAEAVLTSEAISPCSPLWGGSGNLLMDT